MNTGGLSEPLGLGNAGRSASFPTATSSIVKGAFTLITPGGANLMGADLYKSLNRYYIHHLEKVRQV
jgi:hypothetical protein